MTTRHTDEKKPARGGLCWSAVIYCCVAGGATADGSTELPQGHLIDSAVDISIGAGRLAIQDVRSDSLTASKASSRVTSLGGQYLLNSFRPSGVECLAFSTRTNVSMTPYT